MVQDVAVKDRETCVVGRNGFGSARAELAGTLTVSFQAGKGVPDVSSTWKGLVWMCMG